MVVQMLNQPALPQIYSPRPALAVTAPIVAPEASELARSLRLAGWVARAGWLSRAGGDRVWLVRFESPELARA